MWECTPAPLVVSVEGCRVSSSIEGPRISLVDSVPHSVDTGPLTSRYQVEDINHSLVEKMGFGELRDLA